MEYKFENTVIPGTKKTPEIDLNKDSGVIKMIGISIPENSKLFYEFLFKWIEDYLKSPQKETKIVVALRYMNSNTTMIINKLFKLIDQNISNPNELSFEWHYEEDDFEMKDVGEYYQELLDHPVTFVEVEEI